MPGVYGRHLIDSRYHIECDEELEIPVEHTKFPRIGFSMTIAAVQDRTLGGLIRIRDTDHKKFLNAASQHGHWQGDAAGGPGHSMKPCKLKQVGNVSSVTNATRVW